jgi:hypothetical protein
VYIYLPMWGRGSGPVDSGLSVGAGGVRAPPARCAWEGAARLVEVGARDG